MEWIGNAPKEIWKYREIIISQVRLVELVSDYGISLEPKESGQFSHRTRCPFHKKGREKTPSFFISNETNSFYCFGCNISGTPIDFVSLMDGSPVSVALEKLAKRAGLIDKNGQWDELQLDAAKGQISYFDPQKNIEPYLFEISFCLYNHIKQFFNKPELDKELIWMELVAEKADQYLSNIDHEDWELAEQVAEKVCNSVKKRNKK